METITAIAREPDNWQPEDKQGKGNWCYAAVTRVIRGELLDEKLNQAEIAHNFYLYINMLGGAKELSIVGSRGKAIDAYAKALNLPPMSEPIPYSAVTAMVHSSKLTSDPTPLLSEAWGDLNLDGLTEDRVTKLQATDENEKKICGALDARGLVAIGTSMHCMVVYGYELDVEGDEVLARRFHIWNPAGGARKVAGLNDFIGDDLYLVTPRSK